MFVEQASAKPGEPEGDNLKTSNSPPKREIFSGWTCSLRMKHQKETLDRIRQEIDSRSAPHPEKVKAAQAQVATLEHVAEVRGWGSHV